ncbi:12958_t:CDS:2 [Gigaspora margarita]|uniref:12958_t:CDS:1 n=1 Tax=Gigaspora margarita TaxID=4874 RepID=A0ABN7VQW1_GIGMA|nr:12958_t:CDS:2 [Gigaspora margarita]
MYYPLSTIEHLPNNNEIIVGAENDTLMFENHVNNFFEYASNDIWMNKSQQELPIFLNSRNVIKTGHIIDDSCTLLDPDTVTALMCQRNWLEVSEKFGWDL